MAIEPGRTISHYRIIEEIGGGGMGRIFMAEDLELGRMIALKTLPESLSRDVERLNRFRQEARALAAVNHPNIVVIHSVEEVDGHHFMTMEMVRGRPLASMIKNGGLNLRGVLDIAIPLVDAVGTAHERGVTHRDIKPANIMIDEEDRLKVLDFGLAKMVEPYRPLGDKTPSTRALLNDELIVGTPDYMSPEQARGDPADHRADIFSIGVVLYELSTGRRPFTGATTAELLAAILRDNPRPATAVNTDCPQRLSHAIERCMAKEPDLRYQSLICATS